MTAAVRQGDLCDGHTVCWNPRAADQWSPNVKFNGKLVIRVGDHFPTHCCFAVCHDGVQATGSPNVNANGKKLARIGDSISCGSKNAQGSPNVFVNGH